MARCYLWDETQFCAAGVRDGVGAVACRHAGVRQESPGLPQWSALALLHASALPGRREREPEGRARARTGRPRPKRICTRSSPNPLTHFPLPVVFLECRSERSNYGDKEHNSTPKVSCGCSPLLHLSNIIIQTTVLVHFFVLLFMKLKFRNMIFFECSCAMPRQPKQPREAEAWLPPKRLRVIAAPTEEVPEDMQEMEVPPEDLRDAIVFSDILTIPNDQISHAQHVLDPDVFFTLFGCLDMGGGAFE